MAFSLPLGGSNRRRGYERYAGGKKFEFLGHSSLSALGFVIGGRPPEPCATLATCEAQCPLSTSCLPLWLRQFRPQGMAVSVHGARTGSQPRSRAAPKPARRPSPSG